MSYIILKENIRKLGRIGEIVNVAPGYAFNFLIPQSKAIPATQENKAALEKQREQMIQEDIAHKNVAQQLAKTLPLSVFLSRDINENGVLYGHITAKDVLEQLPQIKDKHSIHFKKNIHSYGVYDIEIELHHDVVVKMHLSISDSVENAKKQLQDFLQPKKKEKKVAESASEDNSVENETAVQS